MLLSLRGVLPFNEGGDFVFHLADSKEKPSLIYQPLCSFTITRNFFGFTITTRCLWLSNASYLSIHTSGGPGLCADTPLSCIYFPRKISEGSFNLATCWPSLGVMQSHLAKHPAITGMSSYSFGGQEWECLTRPWTSAFWLPWLYSTVGMNCFCN